MVREAEAVVRAQQQDRPSVEEDARALRAAHHAHAAIEPELHELVKPILQLQHLAPSHRWAAAAAWAITVRPAADGSGEPRPPDLRPVSEVQLRRLADHR